MPLAQNSSTMHGHAAGGSQQMLQVYLRHRITSQVLFSAALRNKPKATHACRSLDVSAIAPIRNLVSLILNYTLVLISGERLICQRKVLCKVCFEVSERELTGAELFVAPKYVFPDQRPGRFSEAG
eukprot:CAMPEP_0181232478 /NCGR_PEP_ID=MMETSP1096-20121128/35753_1 /TAXON_ID=156174 ORGANISM="Chrysochromulina ericina, Strain CCMP281" /NCGR_SAMPLE_ID=MMETSP1096 /ASSEMBLY_ACC=CAM_ASM_000453 /LENGTH=125 /DNA_ID=CAMNT_0023326773 /DNA_START=903 /DNA_END=1276 /DNA_ORIENTATION=-